MKLKNSVALVTGASGGIGSEICVALAAEGASIAIHYATRREAALNLKQRLQQEKVKAEVFQADITSRDQAERLVRQVADCFGALDILVNNAGWTQVVPSHDLAGLTEELLEKTLRIKIHAPLYLIRAARELLAASNCGSIINVTSVAGIAARGSSIPYAAANAALSNLTRSLARSLAPHIRVNAVAPGYVETGFAYPGDGNAAARVSQNNHLGRCSTPAEIAAVVRFLICEASSITGEEIAVDAGIARLGKK